MTTVTVTDFRKNMAQHIQQVQSNHTPITVTTQKQGAVVVVPLDQWISLQETLYLVSSPANKSRLDQAVADIRAGTFTTHNLAA